MESNTTKRLLGGLALAVGALNGCTAAHSVVVTPAPPVVVRPLPPRPYYYGPYYHGPRYYHYRAPVRGPYYRGYYGSARPHRRIAIMH